MDSEPPIEHDPSFSRYFQGWSALLAGFTLVFGYLGMGFPQHYYQPLFAALTLAILYRHQKIRTGNGAWKLVLIAANFLMLCLLYKLLIGGGVSHPFDWLKIPNLTSGSAPADAPWHQKLIPSIRLEMKPVPIVSEWSIDITKLQTLFLLATLAGAVFRFQPFASFAAMGLLLVSVPTFTAFNWDWVILFLVCCGTSFYLQSPVGSAPRTS
ncbi:MAG: hypothetical protein ACWGOV_02975 [Acidiferrobacterales bacterium]